MWAAGIFSGIDHKPEDIQTKSREKSLTFPAFLSSAASWLAGAAVERDLNYCLNVFARRLLPKQSLTETAEIASL
jgi:hypothetical protein